MQFIWENYFMFYSYYNFKTSDSNLSIFDKTPLILCAPSNLSGKPAPLESDKKNELGSCCPLGIMLQCRKHGPNYIIYSKWVPYVMRFSLGNIYLPKAELR